MCGLGHCLCFVEGWRRPEDGSLDAGYWFGSWYALTRLFYDTGSTSLGSTANQMVLRVPFKVEEYLLSCWIRRRHVLDLRLNIPALHLPAIDTTADGSPAEEQLMESILKTIICFKILDGRRIVLYIIILIVDFSPFFCRYFFFFCFFSLFFLSLCSNYGWESVTRRRKAEKVVFCFSVD